MELNVQPSVHNNWAFLYRIAGVSALLTVAITPIQVVVFIASPPPETVLGIFDLFGRSPLLGLLSLDLLYLVINVLALILFPGIYVSLKDINKSVAVVALVLGIAGAVSFFNSNTAFNMLDLFQKYDAASSAAEASVYLAAGESMMAIYTGTAFHMHYILGSVALLLLSIVMLASPTYGKIAAVVGIVTNTIALGLYVPRIGVYISAFSALGYAVWFSIVGLKLFALARTDQAAETNPILPATRA